MMKNGFFMNKTSIILAIFLVTVICEKLVKDKYKVLYFKISVSLGYLAILTLEIFLL
jgi:hypothetical protein